MQEGSQTGMRGKRGNGVGRREEGTLRGVKLINSVSKTLPVIEADAYRCTQLMYNLISNAIKFTNQARNSGMLLVQESVT